MIKHHINGLVKPKHEQEEYCDSCKNGDIWKDEKPVMEDPYSPKDKDYICNVCLSKYIIKRKPYTNPLYEQIKKDLLEVEKKMDADELDFKRQLMRELKECPGHIWVESKPFKTAEGKYTVVSCLVCRLGRISYKGHIYEDDVMRLINFVTHKGIEYEKKLKQKEETLKSLADVCYGKDVAFNDLFIIGGEEEFSFDKEKEFSFED